MAAAAFGCLAGAMIAFPGEAAEAAWGALCLWARAVAPVLGPFMASVMMITSRVSGGMALYTLLGWLGGSPGGARAAQGLKLRGRSALRLAALTGTMSPMFFLGTVSKWLSDSKKAGVLLACHLLGALLAGLAVPGGRRNAERTPPHPMPLGTALRESGLALMTVALCMMLGAVAARMALCALPGLPQSAAAALQCALEVTAGVKSLIALGLPHLEALICAACSLGGLSLLMQNAAFWQESGIKPWQLLLLRLLHALISYGLCRAALLFT